MIAITVGLANMDETSEDAVLPAIKADATIETMTGFVWIAASADVPICAAAADKY